MLDKVLELFFNVLQLRGIPRVSAWIGSHRWARIIAWWVFQPILWGLSIIGSFSVFSWVAHLELELTIKQSHVEPALLPLLLILAVAYVISCMTTFLIIPFCLPIIGYTFLFKHPETKGKPAESWVDYLDPDRFLKVPYSRTAPSRNTH